MNQDKYLKSWQERQELAEAMQPLLGKLFRQQGIEITVYGRPLLSATTIDIIKAHRNVRQHNGEKLRLRESFPLLLAIAELDIKHARLDLGKLAVKFATAHGSNYDLVEEFLKVE
ncbi:MAG: glyceraldehyde-3-phosphate dehydrogenase, partial [Gammaproteobacteria bacterium]|nr:glyceraldehyde-3-phosphate dehydrogenase [Gammaproteobacteria bacterium]